MGKKLSIPQGSIKYILGWIFVFAIRLMPYRPPNIEPVMSALMPFSKKYGRFGAFTFAFLSIALFDLATGKVGIWTWITASAYGSLGIGSALYFKKRPANIKNFVTFSIIGTLTYDALTGLSIGPLFWGQSLAEAFFGQIPFTAWHLLSNIALAGIISPILYHWIVQNEKIELSYLHKSVSPSAHY